VNETCKTAAQGVVQTVLAFYRRGRSCLVSNLRVSRASEVPSAIPVTTMAYFRSVLGLVAATSLAAAAPKCASVGTYDYIVVGSGPGMPLMSPPLLSLLILLLWH
jgi:hypothetical protein